jgi:hypothetical protein
MTSAGGAAMSSGAKRNRSCVASVALGSTVPGLFPLNMHFFKVFALQSARVTLFLHCQVLSEAALEDA